MSQPPIVYFIGDVHGRFDRLQPLIAHLEADADKAGRAAIFMFLGDLVDRGPESMECVDLAMKTVRKHKGSKLHKGNHDDWFVEAIETRGNFMDMDSWLMHGGLNTLRSYGYDEETTYREGLSLIALEYREHIDFLKKGELLSLVGPFACAHAGINPGLPLDRQREDDLLWIRQPFLTFVDPTMTPVIHGHSIMGPIPVVTENRISIDTGSFKTGCVTCCRMDESARNIRFIQSSADGVAEIEPHLLDRGYGTIMDRLDDLFEPKVLRRSCPA